jgi:hypothetical protein
MFLTVFYQSILWHVDPLLGNDHETNKKQPLLRNGFASKHVCTATNGNSKRNGDFCAVRAEILYAGSSTVTLRVAGGDEKGSLKSETVKYGRESQGTQTRERLRWQAPAAYTKGRPVLSSEKAPHKNKTVTVSDTKTY